MERLRDMNLEANYFEAYYKCELIKTIGNNAYSVNRLLKLGNHPYFNALFSVQEDIKFKRLQPKGISGDYVLYPLEFKDGNNKDRVILFETSLLLHPYGIVNIAGSSCCIFFRESAPNLFEIFIINDSISQNQRAQIFTLLIDGALNKNIDELFNNF